MASTVADKSSAVCAMEPDWNLARALLGGTRAMRVAGPQHLPKWPNEEDKAYAARLASAVLFPAYKRTVSTLTGKPFSKPITIGKDVPGRLKPWLEDVDLQGRNLDTFAASVMETALGYGICGILVDCPNADGIAKTEGGLPTQADEAAAGIRPYMIMIYPWQVLGWRAERSNGTWVLNQLRLMECVEEEDGEYGVVNVEQVRVLTPGAWQTFRKDGADPKQWIPHDNGTTTLKQIPYVTVYGERTGFMTAEPPLIEVANLNVSHWQSASDQQTILHAARVPILALIGVDDGGGENDKSSVTIGASTAVKIPLHGDMKFVEHTGKAIEAGANDIDKIEERMRQAGAELLVLTPGKITATQVNTENAVGMCALQRIVQGEEDALDYALQFMAEFVQEPTGGHVEIFNDYGAIMLAEASTDVLLKMAQAGKISDETLFDEFQRRGIVASDLEWSDEKAKLDEQGPPLGALTDPTVDPVTGLPVKKPEPAVA